MNNSCRYTLKVLSDIGDGEKVSDQVIIDWVNNTLKQGQKDSYINSFKVNPIHYQWIQYQICLSFFFSSLKPSM